MKYIEKLNQKTGLGSLTLPFTLDNITESQVPQVRTVC